MTKIVPLALLTLAVLTSEASAWPRIYFDSNGKLIGSAVTEKSKEDPPAEQPSTATNIWTGICRAFRPSHSGNAR